MDLEKIFLKLFRFFSLLIFAYCIGFITIEFVYSMIQISYIEYRARLMIFGFHFLYCICITFIIGFYVFGNKNRKS